MIASSLRAVLGRVSTPRFVFKAHKSSKRTLDLSRFVGNVQTPYDNTAPAQKRSITKRIVAQHRLGPEVAYHTMMAWHALQKCPTEILQPTVIALLLKHFLAKQLDSCDWRRGKAQEKDIVCVPEPSNSIRVKTTSRHTCDALCGSASMHGALRAYLKGESATKVRDGYHLIVSYRLESMRLHKIRFGWLQDVDFVMHSSSRSAPRCPARIARSRLLTLYDDDNRHQPPMRLN